MFNHFRLNNIIISLVAPLFLIFSAMPSFSQNVTINETTNVIYVSNYYANTVSVINGATNAVTATIPVGSMPRGIVANPNTNTVYVLNYGSKTVSVINGATNTVTATLSCGTGSPSLQKIAINPITNQVYFPMTVYSGFQAINYVFQLDGATNTFTHVIYVSVQGPTIGSIAVNPVTNTMYVVTSGQNQGILNVFDGATGSFITSLSLSNAANPAVNSTTNTIYVPTVGYDDVSVVNGVTNTQTAVISNGSNPALDAVVNEATNLIYVTNANTVSVFSGATNTMTGTIPVSGNIGVNAATNTIYLAGANSVSVVNGASNTVIATIPL